MEQLKKEFPPKPGPAQDEATPDAESPVSTPADSLNKVAEQSAAATVKTAEVVDLRKEKLKRNLRRFGAGGAAVGGLIAVPGKASAAAVGGAEAVAMASHSGGFWAGVGKTLGGIEFLAGFGFIVRWVNDQIRKQVTGTSGGGGGAKKSGGDSHGGGDHH